MDVCVITDNLDTGAEIIEAVTDAIPEAEIETTSSVEEMLELDAFYMPDIVFVDTDTTGKNTIDLAARIRKMLPDSYVVLVDDYGDYALEAFEVDVRGYITRPVTAERVSEEYDNWQSKDC